MSNIFTIKRPHITEKATDLNAIGKYVFMVEPSATKNEIKKAIKKIDGHFNTYTFSMTDDPHKEEFADVADKVTVCAIPEVILKVYREIFKE